MILYWMVCIIHGGQASFSDGESTSVLSKDLLNLEPFLDNPGYALEYIYSSLTYTVPSL